MKQALIEMICNQNKQMDGKFIDQPVTMYVEKIYNNANIQLYTVQGNLAGFVAYYCNDPSKDISFLTMLCVDSQYLGKGIGKHLLHSSISYVKSMGFSNFGLEVKEYNQPAIKIYKNAGFEITRISEGTLSMNKRLKNEG